MKKLAMWLQEHAIVFGDGGRESVLHLWCVLISFVLMMIFALCGWTKEPMYWLCVCLYLIPSFLPPIIAFIIKLLTKKPWNPWYWFPIVIGNAIGTLITMVISYIFDLI